MGLAGGSRKGLGGKGLGGSRGLGGGKKKPASAEPQGIRVISGKVRVRDVAHMRKLHAPEIPCLDLQDVMDEPQFGPPELHHGRNADKQSRRTDDASVVKLYATAHQWVEMHPVEERNLLGPLFGTWGAFSYWCHVRGVNPRSEGAGEQFRKEVLVWLHNEQAG